MMTLTATKVKPDTYDNDMTFTTAQSMDLSQRIADIIQQSFEEVPVTDATTVDPMPFGRYWFDGMNQPEFEAEGDPDNFNFKKIIGFGKKI